nr:mucin-4-like [Loxodonta africana]
MGYTEEEAEGRGMWKGVPTHMTLKRRSKPASSVTHTTLEGTTTSSSSTANSPTASGSASPETATPGKVTIFSAAPSINSHITQSTTDSLSTVPSLVTTPEIMGNVSNPVTSTILPTVSEVSTTGGPTEQSTPTSSSSSPGETSAISHMAQTTRNITTRGSETFTSVSQVTDTFSTVTSPPPSPPTNGHTFPQTMATTTSPSGTSTTFLSSSVTNGHTSQTGKETSSVGETAGPTTVISTTLSDVTSSSPPKNLSTSGEVLATSSSSDFHKNITTAILMPTGGPRNDSKKPTQASTSSVGISNTSTHEPSATVETLTSTSNPTTRTNFVSSTNTPSSAAGSTLTVSQEPVSHPSLGTTSATSSETSTSQPTPSYTSAHMPTSPVAPSRNTNKATELGSSTTSLVTSQGNPGDVSDTVTSATTSDGSTTEGPTRQSTPISIRTSVQQSSAVSQIGRARGSHSTQESQITDSFSPMTDNINTVTDPNSSFKPSGPSPSETFPQNTLPTGEVTFTTTHPVDVNTTQVTRELVATPTNLGTTLGTSADTAHSIASTTQVTTLVSTSRGPAGQSVAPSTRISPDAMSTISQTHHTQSFETTRQPDSNNLVSPGTDTTLDGTTTPSSSTTNSPTASERASTGTATLGKVTVFTSTPSSDCHRTQSTTELLSTVTRLVPTPRTMGNVSILITSTIFPTISEISTTGEPKEQSTPTSSSSPPQDTSKEATKPVNTISIRTSVQQSSAVSQIGHTLGSHSTQESQITGSVSPMTDNINTVTTPTPSFKPSGPSPSGTFPQDTSATSEGTTFTTAQPTDIMNKTQVTGGLLATPTSPDTTLGTSADTAHSIASTTPQVTSLFSTSGGPAGQSAGPSTTTSPDATSAFFQTHQTQSIETTGQPDTSKPASSVTHTTLEGTTTSSSSTANSPTASGSASPETATPGKVTIFSAAPSINSRITQSTTDSLSTVPSLVTTPEIMGNVSNPVTSTILPTVSEVSTTGGPTEQSTPTSSSSSPGETSAISHMAQTTRNITTRGSETFTSVSQVTDTFSTVTSPPPSPPTNGHTFPQTMATTTSPSGTSTTFLSSSVTNGHTSQTGKETSSWRSSSNKLKHSHP